MVSKWWQTCHFGGELTLLYSFGLMTAIVRPTTISNPDTCSHIVFHTREFIFSTFINLSSLWSRPPQDAFNRICYSLGKVSEQSSPQEYQNMLTHTPPHLLPCAAKWQMFITKTDAYEISWVIKHRCLGTDLDHFFLIKRAISGLTHIYTRRAALSA